MATRFVSTRSKPGLGREVRAWRTRGRPTSSEGTPPNDVRETVRGHTSLSGSLGPGMQGVEVEVRGDLQTRRGARGLGVEGRKEEIAFLKPVRGVSAPSSKLDEPQTPQNVEAKFDNGILTVVVPKAKAGRRRKASARPADRVPWLGKSGIAR